MEEDGIVPEGELGALQSPSPYIRLYLDGEGESYTHTLVYDWFSIGQSRAAISLQLGVKIDRITISMPGHWLLLSDDTRTLPELGISHECQVELVIAPE